MKLNKKMIDEKHLATLNESVDSFISDIINLILKNKETAPINH